MLLVGGVCDTGLSDDVMLVIDLAHETATQECPGGDVTIICARQRFAHTLEAHNGLLYAVGGAELTADEPENPLQEKICAYTAPLPKPHKVDAAPALADATAPAADDD